MLTEHAPGVYFGMPEAEYHADPALGSTDMKRLLVDGPEYWHASPHNPKRPVEKDTPSYMLFGKAVHKFVLEGEAAFRDLYGERPTGDDVLVTDADLGKWLTEHGVNKLPRSKAEKVSQVLYMDPTVRIRDDIEDTAARQGITLLPADEYRLILDAIHLIQQSPDLATAFVGGVSEVSVFWAADVMGTPVRKKCRIDYLKVRGNGDLKSIGNTKGLPFGKACINQIANLHYDLQAAHYLEGRAALAALVVAGQVEGDHDPAWLARVAAEEEHGWYWVFFHSDTPPRVFARQLSPGSQILDIAQAKIARALATYRDFYLSFGLDTPWAVPADLKELELADMPAWYGKAD